MIKINYSIRCFPDKRNSQVICRVRWNKQKNEVGFVSGVYVELDKWDYNLQRAKKNTSHNVRSMSFSASEINSRIAEICNAIDDTFQHYSIQNSVPSTADLKTYVNEELGRQANSSSTESKIIVRKTLLELYEEFIKQVGFERNWDKLCVEKYRQAVTHITKAVPNVSPDNLTLQTMLKLRDWYIKEGYKNRTINKQVVMLKTFLKWINSQEGYTVPREVLEFQTNLKVMRRTVTFLHFEELMHFFNFKLEESRLANARDQWCFMAFTSLRYSDLSTLKRAHIIKNERIEKWTEKTDEHICVPLVDAAKEILARTPKQESGLVFDVLSDQKLNDYVKEAAKLAGLDREVVNTYYVGTTRVEEVNPFHEVICCHDARRTFVSCSLAMGIPAQVVMKSTGHHSLKTMSPYIDTATETQTLEMEKWNKNNYRAKIMTILDSFDEDELKQTLEAIKAISDKS